MQLHLVAVGKLRPALREVCDDYVRRLMRQIDGSHGPKNDPILGSTMRRKKDLAVQVDGLYVGAESDA